MTETQERLLKVSDVQRLLGGIDRSSVYNLVNAGVLPRPLKIGKKLSRWSLTELLEVMEGFKNERKST